MSASQDFLNRLRRTPIEAPTVRGYRIWEPKNGWPEDFMDMVQEMLKRGYEIELIANGAETPVRRETKEDPQ